MIMYFIQKFYLRTSRVIRLLEIELKAPLQSQLLEVHTGLLTLRAFGWTEHYQERNKLALTASQQPYYLLFCLQRWLNLVLDLLVAAIAILVVSIATTIARNSTTGFLGVALFNIVNFSGSLQQLIAQWTTLETSIGALSRIKSFVALTPALSSLIAIATLAERRACARLRCCYRGVSGRGANHAGMKGKRVRQLMR